jgi:hypothetical protein
LIFPKVLVEKFVQIGSKSISQLYLLIKSQDTKKNMKIVTYHKMKITQKLNENNKPYEQRTVPAVTEREKLCAYSS